MDKAEFVRRMIEDAKKRKKENDRVIFCYFREKQGRKKSFKTGRRWFV